MHFQQIKHGFSETLYPILHEKPNYVHQNTHLVFSQRVFCENLSRNTNMLQNYPVRVKKIIPRKPHTFGLLKLHTNLPLYIPKSCIYFWGVSFQPFLRNNFLPLIFLKNHQILAILDDIFVLRRIGKNTKSPFCFKICMICYFYDLFGCITVLKRSYFEFLAISVFQRFGKKM